MSIRPASSHIAIRSGRPGVREAIESSNFGIKYSLMEYVSDMWNRNSGWSPVMILWPFRLPPGSVPYNGAVSASPNPLIRFNSVHDSSSSGFNSNIGGTLGNKDYTRFKLFQASPGSQVASDHPQVFGSIMLTNESGNHQGGGGGANVMSVLDVGVTQIGPVYVHPLYQVTFNITANQPYITSISGITPWTWNMYTALAKVVQINSGPDKGTYLIRHWDHGATSKLYLVSPDGTVFNPSTTQTGVTGFIGSRTSYFNEVSVIPNSRGSVSTGGTFQPGNSSMSYIARIHFEKSGSPSPTDSRQHGTYWFSLKGWTHGDGIMGNYNYEDDGEVASDRVGAPSNSNGSSGGFYYGIHASMNAAGNTWGSAMGYAYDQASNRLWVAFVENNSPNVSSICYWNYRTPESLHEVSGNGIGGTGVHKAELGTPINMAGTIAKDLHIGSDRTVYTCLSTAQMQSGGSFTNTGIAAIHSDLSTQQVRCSDWGLTTSNIISGMVIDRSRARSVTGGVTTGSSNHITTATSSFTAADLGRFIKVTGVLGDNGTYKISAVNSGTDVTVTTTTGGAVTFTGGAGGSFQIGDRLYLAWNDVVTQSGSIKYLESLDLTVLNSQTVTMTNGKQLEAIDCIGQFNPHSVDQFNGKYYWGSNDTAVQINVYDPTTQTVTSRPITDFNGLNGGAGSISNPTKVRDIRVNSAANSLDGTALFNDLWIATDNGFVKLDKTNFTGSFRRYYGTIENLSYSEPSGFIRSAGTSNSASSTEWVSNIRFGIDGRVYATANTPGTFNGWEWLNYNRESDNWTTSSDPSNGSDRGHSGPNSVIPSIFVDPYGGGCMLFPENYIISSGNHTVQMFQLTTHYQWDSLSSQWFPKEVVRGGLPDSISSPGCSCKPLHTTLDNLVMGAMVQFTPQGGATPANNEFLGRAGQVIGYGATDGATDSTTATSHTFTGSGFTSADVGRILRLESGSNQGSYMVTGFTDANHITVRQWNNASFTWAGETTLTYTLWDVGVGGSGGNAGPENASFYLANGFGKDNTQDISNVTCSFFFEKTLLYDQAEGIKFATDIIGPPGSVGPQIFSEYFSRTTYQYEPGLGNHRAVPAGMMTGWTGTTSTMGSFLLDFGVDKPNNGTFGCPQTYSSPSDLNFFGIYADSNVQGYAAIVDFGAQVEVGSIILRMSHPDNSTVPSGLMWNENTNTNGLIGHWYNEGTPGSAPGNSSTVRCSGAANLNLVYRNNTISLNSPGDTSFLGSVVLGPNTTGSVTQNQNTLVDAAATFTPPTSGNPGHLGMIIQLTTGSDAGYYRITNVSADGSTVSVSNLDQTAKSWVATNGAVTYQIRDGVQDGDLIAITTAGNTAHRLCVERLLNTGYQAQVRVLPGQALTNQSWNCFKPTWQKVKRISYSTIANPPDVKNNGTWVSGDGREQYTTGHDVKIYCDLSDLPTWQRTGRYWKWAAMPRWPTGSRDYGQYISCIEFYDPSGRRIGVTRYNSVDAVWDQPNFMFVQQHRFDFIQASDLATGIVGFNGLASVGGPNIDTVTLASSQPFLGFQVRMPGASGSAPGASNVFNCGGSDPVFQSSDVGRLLRVTSGVNAGIYRIASVVSTTQVTLVTPAGNTVTLAADAGPSTFTVHEGINVGTSTPDYIAFTTGGVSNSNVECSIKSISDDLKTIVLNTPLSAALTNQNWEIRRRAYDNSAQSNSSDATFTARALYDQNMMPLQPGDFAIDSRGSFRCYTDDIGRGNQRTDGAPQAGTLNFVGSGFCQDDVGRLLLISTGPNKGWYKISAFSSSTQVTVATAYPTGIQTLGNFVTDSGSQTYKIFGERRFRCARYTAGVRS